MKINETVGESIDDQVGNITRSKGSRESRFIALGKLHRRGIDPRNAKAHFLSFYYISKSGYLERLFVKKDFRQQGFAKSMINTCELWAKSKECHEFASDFELENEESLAMYLKLGFQEANRVI